MKSECQLKEILKKRNPCIEESHLIEFIKKEVVKTNGKPRANCFNIILRVDEENYRQIMLRGRLFAGWTSCKVVDNRYIRRCYNCLGFNHIASECRNKETCGKCGEENHKKNDCTSTEEKCSNCIITNKKLNLKVDINHNVWSAVCPIYKKA